jgi:hypothetical protein
MTNKPRRTHKAKGRSVLDLRPPNKYTGHRRRWICHNHSARDSYLEAFEAHCCGKNLSPDQLREIAYTFWCVLRSAERRLTWATSPTLPELDRLDSWLCENLTESELRYCCAEGIDPVDYVRAR